MDTPTLKNMTRLVRFGELTWLAYLAALAVMGYALAREPNFVPWFSVFQSILALLVLALTWASLAARLGRAYFPLVIFFMSVVPIALNSFSTRFGAPLPFFSADGVVFRLTPLLVMALVLLAWRYEWWHVIGFSIGVTVWAILCSIVNLLYPVPPDQFQPRIAELPPVLGVFPVSYAAPTIASLVQFAVLLVVGAFVSLLMQRLRQQHADLERLARTDPLTGVLHRRYFWEMAEIQVQRAKRYDRAITIALFDLDHFKKINDTYGHAVGDAVIRYFAAAGKQNLRGTDLFVRYGGEEFVCMLETGPAEALKKAEKIRATLQTHPLVLEQQTIPLTVSVGVAGFEKTDAYSLDELVNRADMALYQAKAAGRNRAILFAA